MAAMTTDDKGLITEYEAWARDHKLGAFSDWEHRREGIKRFAWAIPTVEAIKAIVGCGPVVEIGAGGGYWASCIAAAGGDVVAYDSHLPGENPDFPTDGGWFTVSLGGPEMARIHSDRALFLCWPPYNDPFGAECLKAYTGDTFIFVGESAGGCTGDSEFWRLLGCRSFLDDDEDAPLSSDWEKIKTVYLPNWGGIHDYLTIYRRKK